MSNLEPPTTKMTLPGGLGPVILGRYELLERIGRGGFSTVYRAYDRKLGRQVAIKAVQRTEELSNRATREARAAAKISHPHIVTVYELAEDEQNIYLVSELVEGKTLAKCIAEATLSDRDALQVILQVLEALEHAHERGVVHRDIKPDNIMLADGLKLQAKVMDFGIAQLENTQRLTRQGDVIGTLAYMSPEQADGRPVDSATDVYSTALTLYECLTGSNPFKGNSASETLARIQEGALPLTYVRPDLPEELSRLVEEAMEPDPRLRLELRSFAAGLAEVLPKVAAGDQATTLLRRADRPRPSVYEEVAGRFGFIAPRIANAALAALVAWAAVYGSSYYPSPWRLPLVLSAAIIWALLPRLGLFALAVVALLPVVAFSVALGAILTAATVVYILAFGLVRPQVALLPVLAVGLGALGVGLVYPVVAGTIGRLKYGLALALLGGVAFTAAQLIYGSAEIDYLGIPNNYRLSAELSGEYNPISVLEILAAPVEDQPVLAVQPGIWLLAALPAALLIRRRHRLADAAGLVLSNGLLAAGYLALPLLFLNFRLSLPSFMKTLLICVIIQAVLLLLSPRTKLESISPHERT